MSDCRPGRAHAGFSQDGWEWKREAIVKELRSFVIDERRSTSRRQSRLCDGDDGCRGPIFIAGVRSEAELLLAMDTADTALMPAR
jgi:hypothetical protein